MPADELMEATELESEAACACTAAKTCAGVLPVKFGSQIGDIWL